MYVPLTFENMWKFPWWNTDCYLLGYSQINNEVTCNSPALVSVYCTSCITLCHVRTFCRAAVWCLISFLNPNKDFRVNIKALNYKSCFDFSSYFNLRAIQETRVEDNISWKNNYKFRKIIKKYKKRYGPALPPLGPLCSPGDEWTRQLPPSSPAPPWDLCLDSFTNYVFISVINFASSQAK